MPDDLKIHILTTAMTLFAQKGFANTSMNDIVKASGSSKGGVYWHFPSKDAIVTAIFEQFFAEQFRAVQPMLADTSLSARSKLLHWITQSGEALETMASQFPSSLEFYALAARETLLRERLVHYFKLYTSVFETVINEGIRRGEWQPRDAHETALTLIALIEGTLLLWGVMPEQINLSQQLVKSVRLVLDGL